LIVEHRSKFFRGVLFCSSFQSGNELSGNNFILILWMVMGFGNSGVHDRNYSFRTSRTILNYTTQVRNTDMAAVFSVIYPSARCNSELLQYPSIIVVSISQFSNDR